MCLDVDVKKTNEFYKKHQKNHKIVVWKILMKDKDNDNQISTPCFRTPIMLGQKLQTLSMKYDSYSQQERKLTDFFTIHGGVIHTYLTRKRAREQAKYWAPFDNNIHFVVRCTADINDFVACGIDEDAGFLKVQIGHNETK